MLTFQNENRAIELSITVEDGLLEEIQQFSCNDLSVMSRYNKLSLYTILTSGFEGG